MITETVKNGLIVLDDPATSRMAAVCSCTPSNVPKPSA